MIYYINKANKLPFNRELIVLNEDESLLYLLKTTGSFFSRMFSHDFSVYDASGMEILQAERDKLLRRNRHVLVQDGFNIGIVEESNIHNYIIEFECSHQYQVKLSGFNAKKWELSGTAGPIAYIFPNFKKWGWRIEIVSDINKLSVLIGLTLIYYYFQDTGP